MIKNKSFKIIIASFFALFGFFAFIFFGRNILISLKTIKSLKQEAVRAEKIERAITKAKNELESSKKEREILDSLFIVNEETEQGIVPFLDGIELDLRKNNKTFEFISVERNKKDETSIVFSGKSFGTFSEGIRSLQIVERELYPIFINKVILSKNLDNLRYGGEWMTSFQANINTITTKDDKSKK